ncbi:MAG: hypothetical protein IT208_15030 [Chthonomonadales bacterium]|nr:hypothetical protein [Chthonomonadales bacterium]
MTRTIARVVLLLLATGALTTVLGCASKEKVKTAPPAPDSMGRMPGTTQGSTSRTATPQTE